LIPGTIRLEMINALKIRPNGRFQETSPKPSASTIKSTNKNS